MEITKQEGEIKLENDEHTIHLTSDRVAYLSLPVPLTLTEKEKLKKYIDMAVSIVCVEGTEDEEVEK